MKIKLLLAPALVLLAVSFAACGGDDQADTTTDDESATTSPASDGNAPAPSGEAVRAAKVEIVDFAYDPDPVTIQVGGKVIWQNEDAAPHTATADSDSFDTGTIEQGKIKSETETFKQAGTYSYFCEIHPTMHGTVKVVEKE